MSIPKNKFISKKDLIESFILYSEALGAIPQSSQIAELQAINSKYQAKVAAIRAKMMQLQTQLVSVRNEWNLACIKAGEEAAAKNQKEIQQSIQQSRKKSGLI